MTQPAEDEQYDGARPDAGDEPVEDSATYGEVRADTDLTDDADAEAEASAEERLEGERRRAAGYLEELQRERAAFINFRRRADGEREQWGRDANAALIHNLLPVLDEFELARGHIPADQQESAWVDGLMLVGRKLASTLEQTGLRSIEAQGHPFDPAMHEAVSTTPAGEDHEPGAVVQEFRRGYKLGDRVLRPSMVVVAQ